MFKYQPSHTNHGKDSHRKPSSFPALSSALPASEIRTRSQLADILRLRAFRNSRAAQEPAWACSSRTEIPTKMVCSSSYKGNSSPLGTIISGASIQLHRRRSYGTLVPNLFSHHQSFSILRISSSTIFVRRAFDIPGSVASPAARTTDWAIERSISAATLLPARFCSPKYLTTS